MGVQFLSFKQAEIFLGEQSHQSFVSGPASPASHPQLNPKKVKSQKGGCQNCSEAVLAQDPHRVLSMTIEKKPTTLSSGELLRFSGTNPRHFHVVTIALLLGNIDVIPPASLRQRGEQRDPLRATQLQCCTEIESEPTSSSKPCPQVPGKARVAREHQSQEFPV